MAELDPSALSHLYRWIDTIPLDRPKKNIARDFSDGVLMSQVIHYFFPRLVELHNYSASNSVDQKNYNWKTLNQKVFKKMGFMISPIDIEAVVQCKRHAIERILLLIQSKIGEYQQQQLNDPLANAPVQASPRQLPPAAVPQPKKQPQQQQQNAKQQQQPIPQHQQAPPQRTKATTQQSQSPTRTSNKQSSSSQQQQQQNTSLPNGKLVGDKDATIHDLRETVDILQLKVQKLEQLLRLKNSKIESLQKKMAEITGQPIQ